MKLIVKNVKGDVVGNIDVLDEVFGVPMNASLVHQVMVGQRANRRQGTASTKTRAQISGGGAKPRPQKHSGRARAGSTRAPQWRGGGVVFGPNPRDFRQATPKRMKRQSMLAMLSYKVKEKNLVILDSLKLNEPKTKEMIAVLESINTSRNVLLVADGADNATLRSARNIPKLKMIPAALLNTVDLLNCKNVVMTEEAVRITENLWGKALTSKRSISNKMLRE